MWHPHFEPLLFDALQEDVFGQMERMTTLADAAEPVKDTGHWKSTLTLFVLAGELDRAADHVDRIQRDDAVSPSDKASLKAHWDRISSDIKTLCTEFHAREAATVKELKLAHIWEPSPFPVEVPAAERTGRTAEPTFSTAPWISRPPALFAEMPKHAGQVFFVQGVLHRAGQERLFVRLTRDEAEERHRAFESYTLAARLPDGCILLIGRSGKDPNDPEPFRRYDADHPPSISVVMYGSSHVAWVAAFPDWDDPDKSAIKLSSITIRKRSTHEEVWYTNASLEQNMRRAWRRSEKASVFEAPITAAERDLIKCSLPAFGEYADMAERIRSLLQVAGYGELT